MLHKWCFKVHAYIHVSSALMLQVNKCLYCLQAIETLQS